jgi:hypothetical protein
MVKRVLCCFVWWLVLSYLVYMIAVLLVAATTGLPVHLIVEAGEQTAATPVNQYALLIYLGTLAVIMVSAVFGILPRTALPTLRDQQAANTDRPRPPAKD